MKVAGDWSLDSLLQRWRANGRPYLEFGREESMSVGLYVLPAGGRDEQQPHTEDEVYVVLDGQSQFTASGEVRDVETGDVIFVLAGVPHRFHDITTELRLSSSSRRPRAVNGRAPKVLIGGPGPWSVSLAPWPLSAARTSSTSPT